MKIPELSILIGMSTTPNQYLILRYLWDRDKESLDKYLKLLKDDRDVNILINLGHIISIGGVLQLNRSSVKGLFEMSEDLFLEFYTTYPIYAPSDTGQQRNLRPASSNTKIGKEAHRKYKSKIKTTEQHKLLMDCLNLELEDRKRFNSMKYMSGIIPYLNQEGWSKFEHLLEEEPQITNREGSI